MYIMVRFGSILRSFGRTAIPWPREGMSNFAQYEGIVYDFRAFEPVHRLAEALQPRLARDLGLC
jgi:hypothetical protein